MRVSQQKRHGGMYQQKFINLIKKLLPLLIITLLPFLFFSEAFTGQSLIALGDFTGSDLLNMHYPYKFALKAALENKSIPLWTPYLSNGFPLLAEGQTGVFYPPNLIFAFFPPSVSLNLSIIFALIMAGIGTYLYVRQIYPKEDFAPLFAAVVFMFSAFFLTRAKHLNMINVASLFPLSIYFTTRFFNRLKFQEAVFAGIIFALMLLAGHPQMAFYIFFIWFIFFLFEFYLTLKNHSFSFLFPRALISLVVIFLTAIGLSAIQLLPTLEFLKYTERLEYTYQVATAYPYHPKNLITFISPYYFGNPATGTYLQNISLIGIFWENNSYLGLLPIGLVLFMIARMIKKRTIDQRLLFFLSLSLFSLFLMLGKFTPLFGLLWSNVPGFTLFRFPTRFNLFLIFSFSIIAASGVSILVTQLLKLKDISSPENEEQLRLTWPLDKTKTELLILGFVIIDLFVFGKTYFGFIKTSDFNKKPESVEFLEKDKELYRIWSVSQYAESPYQIIGWKKDLEPILKINEALPPDNNLIYKISSFSDRPWFEGGLNYKRRNEMERYLSGTTDQVSFGKLLGLYNVKYLLSFSDTGGLEIEKVKEIDLGKSFGTTLKIFENKQNMPRIYFVPEAKVVPSEERYFEELTNPNFYPAKTVLIEKNPAKTLPAFGGVLDEFQKNNKVKLISYSANSVKIKVEAKNDGFLVLSDSFYPGWKAKVDEKPVEILQANYLVRAVQMEPGNHTVRFVYDPLSFKIGVAISGMTLGALIGIGMLSLRAKFSI